MHTQEDTRQGGKDTNTVGDSTGALEQCSDTAQATTTDVGTGQLVTWLALPSLASMPEEEIQCPRKRILVQKSFVFFGLQ